MVGEIYKYIYAHEKGIYTLPPGPSIKGERVEVLVVSARRTTGGLDKKSGTSLGSKGKGSRVIVMSLPHALHVS